MLTVFERIPDLFVQVYDYQFQVWAREFRTRGPKCAVRFGRRKGSPAPIDNEGRRIEPGAWLTAEVDSTNAVPRVIIRPASEKDEDLIARHTRDLATFVLQ